MPQAKPDATVSNCHGLGDKLLPPPHDQQNLLCPRNGQKRNKWVNETTEAIAKCRDVTLRSQTSLVSAPETLAPGELAASGAARLGAAQRAALLSASHGALRRTPRGWRGEGHPLPIKRTTVDALRARNLVELTFSVPARARITSTGRWYARTLCSELAGDHSLPSIESLPV